MSSNSLYSQDSDSPGTAADRAQPWPRPSRREEWEAFSFSHAKPGEDIVCDVLPHGGPQQARHGLQRLLHVQQHRVRGGPHAEGIQGPGNGVLGRPDSRLLPEIGEEPAVAGQIRGKHDFHPPGEGVQTCAGDGGQRDHGLKIQILGANHLRQVRLAQDADTPFGVFRRRHGLPVLLRQRR